MAYDPTLVLDMRSMMPFMSGGVQYVRDFSGYGNHGTPLVFAGDDSEYVSSDMGQAVLLDGTKSISIPDTYFPAYGFDRTLITYVTPIVTGAIEARIFSYGTWLANQAFQLVLSTTTRVLTLVGHTGNYVFTNPCIYANVNQISAVISSGRVLTYFNGRPDSNQASTLATVLNGTAYIGQSPATGAKFVGYVHRVQMYARAFGATEMYNNYINRFRV